MSAVKQNNSFSIDRIAAGLSLADIERELGVSARDVESWETGAKQPPHHVINALDMIKQCKSEPTQPSSTRKDRHDTPQAGDRPDADVSQNATDADALIKSKKRVADHGEVFTRYMPLTNPT